jgi:hypothetical protein
MGAFHFVRIFLIIINQLEAKNAALIENGGELPGYY